MILFADSGSTKTTWAATATDKVLVTEGLNPLFSTDDTVLRIAKQVLDVFGQPAALFFYGAGCGTVRAKKRLSTLFGTVFQCDYIGIHTDMLAACHAVSSVYPAFGIVAILGTGSNTCLYEDNTIQMQLPSGGYILGDHGSANHIGRVLLRDWMGQRMPLNLSIKFQELYELSYESVIHSLYHGDHPNRYLASFAPFATQNMADEYCNNLITSCLEEWYTYQVDPLLQHTSRRVLSVVGGLAAHLIHQIDDLAGRHDLTVMKVVENPIEGLRRFHTVLVD